MSVIPPLIDRYYVCHADGQATEHTLYQSGCRNTYAFVRD
jgi:hypothetical protein